MFAMNEKNLKKQVVGVRFVSGVKIYYFDPGDLELKTGDYVVVESQEGYELAKVVFVDVNIDLKELNEEDLLAVVRLATKEDKKTVLDFYQVRKEYINRANQLARSLKLPIKFIDGSKSLDEGGRLLFLFAAEGRVDFRDLLVKMNREFQTLVRLYQVGPRDAARIVGGVGICGQKLCCSRFLNKFDSITMDMARIQDLNNVGSGKISGVCGKLLCCLAYEVDMYKKLSRKLPDTDDIVEVEKKLGRVVDRNVLMQTVTVVMEGSELENTYPVEEVKLHEKQGNKKGGNKEKTEKREKNIEKKTKK
jgi:cell fate regulator YaaT (PSP1 superfamily)